MYMSNRSVLQVPMSVDLRRRAEAAATEHGLSSLQEMVRLLLHKLTKNELTLSVREPQEERLSPKAERRYAKMIADIKAGRNVTKTESLDELFAMLRA